jgi:hypothetical protein
VDSQEEKKTIREEKQSKAGTSAKSNLVRAPMCIDPMSLTPLGLPYPPRVRARRAFPPLAPILSFLALPIPVTQPPVPSWSCPGPPLDHMVTCWSP